MSEYNSKLYKEKIKNIIVNIERAEKSASIKDFIASISHLRRVGELFSAELLRENGISERELSQLKQIRRLDNIRNMKYITDIDYNILNELRETGNKGVHKGEADKNQTNRLLNQTKTIVNNWISKM